MFKWLKDRLFPKPVVHHTESFIDNMDLLVTFGVKDGNIEVTLSSKKYSDEYADSLGKLLFYVNNGYFIEHFAQILAELSKKDVEVAKFVEKTVKVWSDTTKKGEEADNASVANDDEEPIVQPDSFMSLGGGKEEE